MAMQLDLIVSVKTVSELCIVTCPPVTMQNVLRLCSKLEIHADAPQQADAHA